MKFIYDRNKTAVIFWGIESYSYKEIIKGIKYYSTLFKREWKSSSNYGK